MRVPRPGTALGLLALFVAVSSGAYAATSLPKNSVTTKQVKDRSLLARDFKNGQIPRGPAGVDGSAGVQGPQGPAGIASISQVVGPPSYACGTTTGGGCTVAGAKAACPAGSVAIGGGFSADVPSFDVVDSRQIDATTWAVIGTNDWPNSANLRAIAICASGPGVAAAAARVTRRTSFERTLREVRLAAEA